MEQLVEKSKQDNIFVCLVNCNGFGFHCEHINNAAPALRAAIAK
ncbi:hypothetical protein NPIL_680981, partial [Nephila pilipes]